MRKTILLLLTLLVTPALAATGWGHYDNGRFGYGVDVPPAFTGGGEADNGDGQVFTSADGTQTVRVYGGNIIEDDFEAETQKAMGYSRDDGWALSYERVTPSWASYSGERNGMILYVRSIAICNGSQYATVEYVYPRRALKDAEPVVDRLVSSLRGGATAAGC